jgi:hypothetical protein
MHKRKTDESLIEINYLAISLHNKLSGNFCGENIKYVGAWCSLSMSTPEQQTKAAGLRSTAVK